MNEFVISTKGLTKRYGDFCAVDNLDLNIPRGTVCGFLGQNGAGKSTTIKMLLGMVRPSSGTGEILGLDIGDENQSVEIRKRVAYVAEDKRLYDYMTVGQIIKFTRPFFADWNYPMEEQLLDEFKLPTGRKIKSLSKGMRTQLALILGLCRNAEIIILDEPSEGLDPVNNEKMLKVLVGLAADGKTIFFSSHHVFEVEQIAEHIIMLHNGKLLDNRPLDQLKANYKLIKLLFDDVPNVNPLQLKGVKSYVQVDRSVTLFTDSNEEQIIDTLKINNPSSIEVINLNLRDIFLESLKAIENYAS